MGSLDNKSKAGGEGGSLREGRSVGRLRKLPDMLHFAGASSQPSRSFGPRRVWRFQTAGPHFDFVRHLLSGPIPFALARLMGQFHPCPKGDTGGTWKEMRPQSA